MKIKVLEIRDSRTFVLALAIDMNAPENEQQRWALRRCGYPLDNHPNILLTRLNANGQVTNDPHAWTGRTWPVAHNYIIEHWNELNDGDVVDVEFALGERTTPKISERLES